jgi:hypothetical protein
MNKTMGAALAGAGALLALGLAGCGASFDPQSVIGMPSYKASFELRAHGYQSVGGYEPENGFRTVDQNGTTTEVAATAECGVDGVTVTNVYTDALPDGRKVPKDTAIITVTISDAAMQQMLNRVLSSSQPSAASCRAAASAVSNAAKHWSLR